MPASKYYSAKEYEYGAAVTMAAVGCGILLIDTILANDCDNDHEPPRPQAHSNKRPERPGKGVRPSRPEYKPIPRHHYSHHHSYSYRNPSVEIVYDFSSLFAISSIASLFVETLKNNIPREGQTRITIAKYTIVPNVPSKSIMSCILTILNIKMIPQRTNCRIAIILR